MVLVLAAAIPGGAGQAVTSPARVTQSPTAPIPARRDAGRMVQLLHPSWLLSWRWGLQQLGCLLLFSPGIY